MPPLEGIKLANNLFYLFVALFLTLYYFLKQKHELKKPSHKKLWFAGIGFWWLIWILDLFGVI